MIILSGLSEGQVLQRLGNRGSTARLTGQSLGDAAVKVTIRGARGILRGWNARQAGKSRRGKWSATLRGIPTGGPYSLRLEIAEESLELRPFFVGDVWLLAGQSNMEGIGNMSGAAKPHPLIRVFSMSREWRLARDPLHLLGESPDACHHGRRPWTPAQAEKVRRSAVRGVGVGIFFARELMRHHGLPIGLIATAHGGTSMSQWNPALKSRGGDSLYGSMLQSLRATGQPIAGVLWYQGENDAGPEAPRYTARMRRLAAAVRRDLRQPRLRWIMAQLARVFGDNDAAAWNSIQEQQRLLPEKIRGLETVAAIDLPLDDGVHIGADGYPVLGRRMARVALRPRERPPQLKAVRVRDKRPGDSGPCIEVEYASVGTGLRSEGPARGFALVDREGRAVPIIHRTSLQGRIARLHCCRPLTPDLRLYYGFGLAPDCSVIDGRGFALPVFGPVPLFTPAAYLPFVTTWSYSGVVAPAGMLANFASVPRDLGAKAAKVYAARPEGFINEHADWQGRSGRAYFAMRLVAPESMTLRFLMGYDGPFCLWLGERLVFSDPRGTNPCFPDQARTRVRLAKGAQRIIVGMDINAGRAWGFMLRFIREGLARTRFESGDYEKPQYLPPE